MDNTSASEDLRAAQSELTMLFMQAAEARRRLSQSDPLCWLCCEHDGHIVYDNKFLCLSCGVGVLRSIVMPYAAGLLRAADEAVARTIYDVEQHEIGAQSLSNSSSGRGASALQLDWTCWKCRSPIGPKCLTA
jgi:hypothetical protein